MSGTDALFLSMETPSWHQHISGLTILQQGARPVRFSDIVEMIDERIVGAPKFRWKLKSMPLGLDRPVWVDDPDFDVRRHVRRIGVPAPGGPRETAEVAGMLLSSQLDRSRPLWELWFLENLANDRVGLVMKYHHCLLDGVSGMSLATLLWDIAPDATGPLVPAPSAEEQSAGGEPSVVEALGRVTIEVAARPLRVARYVLGGARKLATGAAEVARDENERAIFRPPATPFNAAIGPRRALSFASVALDDLKQLKVHHDVKINDVVMALVSGALRNYLLGLDVLPDSTLTCAMPISTRAEGDTTMDNQVSATFVALATHIADPVERLHAIHTSSQSAKAMQRAMAVHHIQSLGEVASPLLLSTAIRAVYRSHLASRAGVICNTIVSNVPGPPIPLYICGARVTGIFPGSVILETMGLNATVISYTDRVDFGFLVDPDLVPDPWAVAAQVVPALRELKQASGLAPVIDLPDAFG